MRNYFSVGSFAFASFRLIRVLKFETELIQLETFVLAKLLQKFDGVLSTLSSLFSLVTKLFLDRQLKTSDC